jgi:hypothetical protein
MIKHSSSPQGSRQEGRIAPHSNAELRSLLSSDILLLYQNNPFRILNIPTDVTPTQVQKRAQKLKVWRQMGERVADEFAVRDALQVLRDPQKRLVAEFFWFHTDAFDAPGSPNATAFEKLKSGAWQEAKEIWSNEYASKSNTESGRRALHNLAVLLHARVVTHEEGKVPLIKTLGGNLPLPPAHIQSWLESLKIWQDYLSCEAAWKHWKARAFDLGDKRMSTHFVSELREILPYALLEINRDLARRYADSHYGVAAGTHCQLMLKSTFDNKVAHAYCRTVLDPLKKRVSDVCEKFKAHFSEDDTASAALSLYSLTATTEKFAAMMRGVSGVMQQIDPQQEFGSLAARENIVQAFRSAAIRVSNRKQVNKAQFETALEIISFAEKFSTSASLKSDLIDTRNQIKFLKDVWSLAAAQCLLCPRRPEDWTVFTNNRTAQERLIFLCGEHAKMDDAWQEDHLLPVISRKWNQLPFPPARAEQK